MTWERVHMGYKSICDACQSAVKRGDHAYLIGTRLLCAECFRKTDSGKRLKRLEKAKRRPPTKAEARFVYGRTHQH